MDDLMARFNSLNEGPYAVDPIDPDATEDYSPPDELQARLDELRNPGKMDSDLPPDELEDRLNELRNPGKMEKELEDYEERQRRYMERYGDEYDFGQKYEPGMPLKREELPLDTDVYSEAVKKIQRVERGRQSRKKYTKKKPEQKKPMKKPEQKKPEKKKSMKKKGGKKKKRKKRYYGGTLTQEQLRKKRLNYLGEPRSDTSDSSNTRRLKEHFLTGIEEDTHSSNFEPEPEPANEVVANEEFPLGTGAEHWLPEETEKELYNSIVGKSDYPTIEDCIRLKEYCVLFPKTCYLNKKFLEEKVHVCREIVKTNNDINRFFSSKLKIYKGGETPHYFYAEWEEVLEDVLKMIPEDIDIREKINIIRYLHELVYELFGVDYTNYDELQEFELYGYSTWIDIIKYLKMTSLNSRESMIKTKFEKLLYNFGIKLKNKGYSIILIENVKQAFMSLLSIYDV